MKKMTWLVVLALVLSIAAPSAFAEEAQKGWWTKSSEKMGRGFSNVFYALLEIPYNVTKEFERTNPIGALPSGILKGAWWTVARAVAGVIDIATFFIPSKPLINDYDIGWWTA